MGLRGIGAKPIKIKKVGRPSKKQGFGSLLRRPITPVELINGKPPWSNQRITRAERVIVFCEELTITSGRDEGQRLRLRKWQKDFINEVYREEGGERIVRTAILSMGRKNGKTQLAAALALCHLCGPESEGRGEVYACANDRFQAGKIFNEMAAMVDRHAWLTARTNISRFTKGIEDLINGSIYATLTAKAETKMGLSPSFVVYDELGQATSRELYEAMDSAMGARASPLMLVISTQAASSAAPLSQLIDYGLKVNAEEIEDPHFHLTLYAAEDDVDPWSKKAWVAANPALGDFRSLEDVKRLASQAQRIPSQENAFRNLILNQRVSAESRFMSKADWKACGEKPVAIKPGDHVYAGLDLGNTQDHSSLAIVREDIVDGDVHAKCYTWVPGDLDERSNTDGAPYEAWSRSGYIIPVGKTTDPEVIAREIARINAINPIRGLGFDRWRIDILKRELDKIGCSVPLVEHGQGFKDMSPAVDLLERLVSRAKLRHGNNPVLTWCANNVIILRDPAGGRKFDKSRAYMGNIDTVVALIMALSTAMVKNKPVDFKFDVDALIG